MADRIPVNNLDVLMDDISRCDLCAEALSTEPRPVVRASPSARLMIIGQAPGRRVHETGIPWNDPSGDRLRDWLQLSRDTFYDTRKIAIMPMGFCYPGTGQSGDLPPRKECAKTWHQPLWRQLPNIRLTLLIGQYAQKYYLNDSSKNLTERVRHWKNYLPQFFALPHPSPRNQLWLKKNPWFIRELVPELRQAVHTCIHE